MNKIYAIIGESLMCIADKKPELCNVEMAQIRPENGLYLAAADGQWVADIAGEKKQIADAVTDFMNAQANVLGYDSVISAITYKDSNVESFKNEAAAFKNWRDDCWLTCFNLLDAWQADTSQPKPGISEVINQLPEWSL